MYRPISWFLCIMVVNEKITVCRTSSRQDAINIGLYARLVVNILRYRIDFTLMEIL
jgi:hypothetical protein